ncbi:MAG: CocE/NonD family hydrolase, partial [Gemmatimonadota bacterium]
PTPEQIRGMTQPILTITGHYDGDQLGTLLHYRRFLQYATPEARRSIYLVMGPWDHGGTRVPTREVNGIEFGPASMVDLVKLNGDWYDWTMKGGSKPDLLKKRVAYYVAGAHAELWKWADSLEAIPTETLKLYLTSAGGRANDAYASGALTPTAPEKSEPDHYTYNPLDPPSFDAGVTHPAAISFVDQSAVIRAAGNGVIYHTTPFAEETEVAGQLSLTAWMSLDVRDTDFQATVYEILPDGKSILLTTTLVRARYRESPRQEKLVQPGAILPYRFTGFPFFARRLAKGSRLRLFLRSPNSTEFQKNYNGGGVVAEESGKDARTAHVTIYHDPEHPSVLEVPITR